jgi:hypothetical protein
MQVPHQQIEVTVIRPQAIAASIAAAAITGLALAGPAQAASGDVWTTGGSAHYVDRGDEVLVYDNERDNHGVVGWISVQQADGSYKNFPRLYVGTGDGTYVSATQDVLREGARMKITVCLIDGRAGTPFNCSFKYFSGS